MAMSKDTKAQLKSRRKAEAADEKHTNMVLLAVLVERGDITSAEAMSWVPTIDRARSLSSQEGIGMVLRAISRRPTGS